MNKKLKNLEIKIAQNRGYTTKLKEKQIELEKEIKLNLDLRLTNVIEWIALNINNKEILQNVINALIITEFGLSKEYGKELLEKLDSPKQTEKKDSEKIKGCFNCKYLTDISGCNNRNIESYKEFMYTTFKIGICSNYKPIKDSRSKKELPKHENGLNHMHSINSETYVPDSKLLEPKETELKKEDNAYCLGALIDGIHDYWETYNLTTDTGRLGFAKELMDMLKEFYFPNFKNKLIEEFIKDWDFLTIKIYKYINKIEDNIIKPNLAKRMIEFYTNSRRRKWKNRCKR